MRSGDYTYDKSTLILDTNFFIYSNEKTWERHVEC